ncbi:MAG: 50S ribosomal protein L29 [Oceanospirillaceae bacterium]|nr:50S ribosomal protein L29 [Oceanospirillaceae bacterium]
MKSNELRDKTSEELEAVLIDELKKQFNLRMQLSTGQLKESHKVKQTRRSIARIKTLLNQKAGE